MTEQSKRHSGFTLVEMLVVLIITVILAGILYVAFSPSDDKAKAVACYGSRTAIEVACDGYRFAHGLTSADYTLQRFINDNYKDMITNNKSKCQSGGTYTMDPDNNKLVKCSVHGSGEPAGSSGGGSGGGGGSGDYIPGTTVPVDRSDTSKTLQEYLVAHNGETVKPGETIYCKDGYYINLANAERAIDSNWMANNDGAFKLLSTPGTVSEWSSYPSGTTLSVGTIVNYDGTYYVARTTVNVYNTEWNKSYPTKDLATSSNGWQGSWYVLTSHK